MLEWKHLLTRWIYCLDREICLLYYEKTHSDKTHSSIPFLAHLFAAPAHTIEAASLPKQSELFVQNQQTYSYFCRRKRCLECRIGNVM
jgi:hypothetical protein